MSLAALVMAIVLTIVMLMMSMLMIVLHDGCGGSGYGHDAHASLFLLRSCTLPLPFTGQLVSHGQLGQCSPC